MNKLNPGAAQMSEVIENLVWEPVYRRIGAGYSEVQECRTHVNYRYIHGHVYFPSPYAKLAGLDDTTVEHYRVFTGSIGRDDIPEADVQAGAEDDTAFFLQFATVEAAVAFCLKDDWAPMEIDLQRQSRTPLASEGSSKDDTARYPKGLR